MSGRLRLPVVSLAAKEGQVVDALKNAATSTGFFYLSDHGVPRNTQLAAKHVLANFFSRKDDEKNTIHKSRTGNLRGYVGFFEQGGYGVDETDRRGIQVEEEQTMDFKEIFHFGTELPDKHPLYHDLLYSQNIWPDGDAEFKDVLTSYYGEMMTVSNMMLEYFALALDLPRHFLLERSLKTPMNSMNCVHYPPLSSFPRASRKLLDGQLGIGAHTDFEAFTLLNQFGPTDACLDIFIENQWEPIPPLEGALVVNIGDMLARWSGDIFQSTVHRARNHPSVDRTSIAFFRAPDFDAVLSSEWIPARKRDYNPILAGEHLLGRISKANEANL